MKIKNLESTISTSKSNVSSSNYNMASNNKGLKRLCAICKGVMLGGMLVLGFQYFSGSHEKYTPYDLTQYGTYMLGYGVANSLQKLL